MTKLSASPKGASGPVCGETKPILMPLACANACIGRPSTAAPASVPPAWISARRRRNCLLCMTSPPLFIVMKLRCEAELAGPVALPGVLQQLANGRALDRPRVVVRVLRCELRRFLERGFLHAEVSERERGADRLGQVVKSAGRIGALQRKRDAHHRFRRGIAVVL